MLASLWTATGATRVRRELLYATGTATALLPSAGCAIPLRTCASSWACQVLELCYRLDIKCVTVYAFSIENFKRSQREVDDLMKLAKDGLNGFCEHECALSYVLQSSLADCPGAVNCYRRMEYG